jgi:ectoine hydroxylase-related dioxygenase (phytanoyl-CoA dioxygenase family)
MDAIKVKKVDEKSKNQALYELKSYGYSRIENYLDTSIVKQLKKMVESRYDENKRNGIKQYPGAPERDASDKIIYSIYNEDKLFIDLLTTEFVKWIAMESLNDPYYRFLPSNKPNYILTYYNARSSGAALDLHIDSYIPFVGEKPNMMQFVFLLEDSTEENGCTVVVPGSHQSGKYTNRSLEKAVPIIGSAGDLIFWDSRLWHGTLENKSKNSRWALVATFGMWWIKQSIDIPRSMNETIYIQCSSEQKQLLGFCSIPPCDPFERTNTKMGYDELKQSPKDYFL